MGIKLAIIRKAWYNLISWRREGVTAWGVLTQAAANRTNMKALASKLFIKLLEHLLKPNSKLGNILLYALVLAYGLLVVKEVKKEVEETTN